MAAVNHHRRGAGEPLVLIHGIGSHWQVWEPVIDRLARAPRRDRGRRRRASGARRRSTPGVEPTVVAYADAFERFFEELGLRRPHVAGNSMGGGIALELARRGAVALGHRDLAGGLLDRARAPLLPALARAVARRPGAGAQGGPGAGRRGRRPNAAHGADLRPPLAHPGRGRALHARGLLGGAGLRGGAGRLRRLRVPGRARAHRCAVTVAWGSRDRLLLFGRQAPRARRALRGRAT